MIKLHYIMLALFGFVTTSIAPTGTPPICCTHPSVVSEHTIQTRESVERFGGMVFVSKNLESVTVKLRAEPGEVVFRYSGFVIFPEHLMTATYTNVLSSRRPSSVSVQIGRESVHFELGYINLWLENTIPGITQIIYHAGAFLIQNRKHYGFNEYNPSHLALQLIELLIELKLGGIARKDPLNPLRADDLKNVQDAIQYLAEKGVIDGSADEVSEKSSAMRRTGFVPIEL